MRADNGRYALRYALRRLVRYAKYAAVGALVATLGAGLLGTLGSGLAFFAAPGIGGGMAIGVITAMIKVSPARYSHAQAKVNLSSAGDTAATISVADTGQG